MACLRLPPPPPPVPPEEAEVGLGGAGELGASGVLVEDEEDEFTSLEVTAEVTVKLGILTQVRIVISHSVYSINSRVVHRHVGSQC